MFGRSLLLSLQIVLLQFISNVTYTNALYGRYIGLLEENELSYAGCIVRRSANFQEPNTVIGTGILISRSHILTVASCFDNLQDSPFELVLRSVTYYPIWWISYDQWNMARHQPVRNGNNDIAVVKILGVNHEIQPAVLASARYSTVYYDLETQVVGCGRTNDPTLSWRRQSAAVTVLHHYDCGNRASQLQGLSLTVSPNYLCTAQVPFIQIAQGDAGGPLILNGAVIGLSIGVAPPMQGVFHPNKLNIHLFIYLYRTFIQEIQENDE